MRIPSMTRGRSQSKIVSAGRRSDTPIAKNIYCPHLKGRSKTAVQSKDADRERRSCERNWPGSSRSQKRGCELPIDRKNEGRSDVAKIALRAANYRVSAKSSGVYLSSPTKKLWNARGCGLFYGFCDPVKNMLTPSEPARRVSGSD